MFSREKLSGFFGLNDDYEEDSNGYQESSQSNYQAPKSSNNAYEEYVKKPKQSNDYFQQSDPSSSQSENVRVSNNKVVNMNSNKSNKPLNTNKPVFDSANQDVRKIAIVEPRTYTEAKDIAKCIFRNETVIVNFHLVEESQARRIVDFLTGTVFALDGDIQRLGDEIFICTPPNMEIDSSTAKSLVGKQFADY